MECRRGLAVIALCAMCAGCVSPSDDARAGDRHPLPSGWQEENPHWQHVAFRPHSTVGYDERMTHISFGPLVSGLGKLGTPQPRTED